MNLVKALTGEGDLGEEGVVLRISFWDKNWKKGKEETLSKV